MQFLNSYKLGNITEFSALACMLDGSGQMSEAHHYSLHFYRIYNFHLCMNATNDTDSAIPSVTSVRHAPVVHITIRHGVTITFDLAFR